MRQFTLIAVTCAALAVPTLASAQEGAAAGAVVGGVSGAVVGGPVGAAVGAGVGAIAGGVAGEAAKDPDRTGSVVVVPEGRPQTSPGCASTTIRTDNGYGASNTVTKERC